VEKFFKQIDNILNWANRFLKPLQKAAGFLGKLGKAVGLGSGSVLEIKIPTFSTATFSPFNGAKDGKPGYRDNYSYEKLKKIDVAAERQSQWVRATYPYVDSLRAPIRQLFRKTFQISNASTYFTHWTNRYTLAISHRIRSKSGYTPHMYVMRDMDSKRKGRERWTKATRQGKRLAEGYFTVIAVVHRKRRGAIIGSSLFKKPSKEGTFAVAQAMFYNANGRDLASGSNRTQPNTGWDTLNWEPPVKAFEWGKHKVTTGGGNPLDVFRGRKRPTMQSRVKLNWQAKLIPITASRIGDALSNPGIGAQSRRTLKAMKRYERHLLSH